MSELQFGNPDGVSSKTDIHIPPQPLPSQPTPNLSVLIKKKKKNQE